MGENQFDAFADKFLKTLHFTKGARFAAHRRLLRKHQWSLLSISMLSTYVIGASLIPIFVKPLPESAPGILAAITTVASIFIIVLSHVESGQGYFTRAEKMLRCAQKISELYYELEQRRITATLTEEFLNDTRTKYSGVLNDYSENHDEIDFLYYASNFATIDVPTEKWAMFRRLLLGRYYAVRYYANICLVRLLLIIVPPLLVFLFVSNRGT